jgi:hypothetical protein
VFLSRSKIKVWKRFDREQINSIGFKKWHRSIELFVWFYRHFFIFPEIPRFQREKGNIFGPPSFDGMHSSCLARVKSQKADTNTHILSFWHRFKILSKKITAIESQIDHFFDRFEAFLCHNSWNKRQIWANGVPIDRSHLDKLLVKFSGDIRLF